MTYKRISALIPSISLEGVQKVLMENGAPVVSISKIHGYDDYRNYFAKDAMSDCARVDIFVEENRVKTIINAVAKVTQQGMSTDGVIAVMPVDNFIRIRDYKEEDYDE